MLGSHLSFTTIYTLNLIFRVLLDTSLPDKYPSGPVFLPIRKAIVEPP